MTTVEQPIYIAKVEDEEEDDDYNEEDENKGLVEYFVDKFEEKGDGSPKFDFSTVPAGTQYLLFPDLYNYHTWDHLMAIKNSPASSTIEVLYLSHDGVIQGSQEAVRSVITSLPKLRKVYACGYYNHVLGLKSICDERGVKLIWIY